MTFEPVLSWWMFIVLAVVIVALRMYTLYRVLVVVGGGSQRKVVLRWSLLTLVIVSVFAAAARPGIEPTRHVLTESHAVAAANSNVNVFFVVDRSINSRAEDYGSGQFRMAGIRADMDAVVNQYPQGRFSITSFATGARVDWPLSEDIWSLRALLKGYSAYVSELDSVYRVEVAAAADELRGQLELARRQYPGSSNVVFYLGEGRVRRASPPRALISPRIWSTEARCSATEPLTVAQWPVSSRPTVRRPIFRTPRVPVRSCPSLTNGP